MRKISRGQGVIEYIILIALIALATGGGLVATGTDLSDAYNEVAGIFDGDGGGEGTAPNPTPVPTQEQGDILVHVINEAGIGIPFVPVLAFDDTQAELATVETDQNGQAVFSGVTDGEYIFRADYQAQSYWSETILYPAETQAEITITEQGFNVHVIDAQGQTLPDVPVFVFNEQKQFTGIKLVTDQNGMAITELPLGKYLFRADYQGVPTWSEVVDTSTVSSVHIRIPISTFTVRVYYETGGAAADLPVYAFNEQGGYTGITTRTNQNGEAVMELPNGNYQFRVDYAGTDFWSPTVTVPNVNSTTIQVTGKANVEVSVVDTGGDPISNTRVYLYDGNGNYLGKGKRTNAQGRAVFPLKAGSYQFRAVADSQNYWSNKITVPNQTSATIRVDNRDLVVTVKNKGSLKQVAVYIFRYPYYLYTGYAKYVDNNGRASFDLPNGTYSVLAYDFARGRYEWADNITIPNTTSVQISIR